MVFRAIVLLLIVGLAIYSFMDCARTRPEHVRGMPRSLWLLATLAVPLVGPIGWLLVGRAGRPGEPPPTRQAPRVVAPDDDPDFLLHLELERRRKQRERDHPPQDKRPDDRRADPPDDARETDDARESREDGDNHSGQAAS